MISTTMNDDNQHCCVRERSRRNAEATRRSSVLVPPAEVLDAGDVIAGTYELIGLLGRGGMSIVYEAKDVNLGRRVAIKMAHAGVEADALRKEGTALAAVRHPGVPTVYGLGRHGAFTYLALEAIGGSSLDRRIDEALAAGVELSIDEVLRVLRGVADALAAVHAAGIVHRDVKASNVMLAGSRVVLLDFGVMLPEFAVQENTAIVGTAKSMAPEQIVSSARAGSGARMDLYALGVLAFEMLARKPPFEGNTVTSIFAAHLLAAVPDVREVRRDTPADLADLVAALMAKDPADRPDSAEVVVWKLDEIRARFSTRSRRVFIVDDDRHVGKALRNALESAFPNLQVESFYDPAQVLAWIETEAPRLVLLDVNMPAVNGVELAMRILALPAARRPAVVAMSAEATQADVSVLEKLGVRAFVRKDDALIERVGDIISELRA